MGLGQRGLERLVGPPITSDDHDTARHEDRRSEPRQSMALAGTIRRVGGPDIKIIVRNLSTRGMMAECPVSFSRGESIEIALPGIGAVTGLIAWTAGGRAGISFSAPVDPGLARKPFAFNRPPPAQ
jgi:hypothetical protein